MIKLNTALTCTYILCTRFKLETCGSGSFHPVEVKSKLLFLVLPCTRTQDAQARRARWRRRAHACIISRRQPCTPSLSRAHRRAREAPGMPSRREGSKLRMHARALLLHLAHLAIGAAAMPPETTTTGDHTCTTSLSPSSLLFLPPPCCCYISLGKKGLYTARKFHTSTGWKPPLSTGPPVLARRY